MSDPKEQFPVIIPDPHGFNAFGGPAGQQNMGGGQTTWQYKTGGAGSVPMGTSDGQTMSFGGKVWTWVKGIGKWVLGNPEIVLGSIALIQHAIDSGKAEDLTNEATDLARQQYADRAPLRAMGMATLTGKAVDGYEPYKAPGLASLGSTSANTPALAPLVANPRNPYSRLNRLPSVSGAGAGAGCCPVCRTSTVMQNAASRRPWGVVAGSRPRPEHRPLDDPVLDPRGRDGRGRQG